jgi:hypothetical protein
MSGPRITRMDTKTGSTEGLTNRAVKHSTLDTSLLCVSAAGREAGSSEPASASFGTGREYENFQLTNRGREAYVLASSSLSASAAGRGAASKEAAPAHFHGAAGPEPD